MAKTQRGKKIVPVREEHVTTIGERIKIGRRAAGLSQRALAEAVGVSATAISKYERELDTPSSGVLLRLAQALGVKTEYFLRPVTATVTVPSFRRRTSLPRKQEYAVMGQIQEWLERYLGVESFFGGPRSLDLPGELDRRVASLDQVEQVALSLRQAWDLGLAPIESLVEVLEDRGIKVGLADGHEDFDALTLWADDNIPVIVVKHGLPGDRQRFNLAHELGHLVLEPAEDVNAEDAAYRFAGAFLVPKSVALFELGDRRQTLSLYELHLLKHKYGLSMQAWVYRAKDLGILSDSSAARLFQQFRQQGWYRQEPGDPIPPEEPGRMKRLVMRALAEDLISESRAAELVGMPLAEFWEEEADRRDGLTQPSPGSLREEWEVTRFVDVLRKHMPGLVADYKVKALGVFGSYVRNEQDEESDLDLLAEFHEPPTLFQFVRLEHYLTDLLGVKTDLVMKSALKPAIGKHILEEVVPV